MQKLKIAFKEATWVFVLSRLLLLITTYMAVALLPPNGQSRPLDCIEDIRSNLCLLAWHHWDAGAYVRIAHQGYLSTPDVAFFPFWPLLMHYGGELLGGYYPFSYYLSGLLLANIFFYFALVLLYCLICEDFEASIAKRSLFYLAFYPYALFFFAGYTESLFVLLCLAVFLLLRRGRPLDWWIAGGIGFLATLTRSTGVLLSIPFFVVYIQRFWIPRERKQHSWLQKINTLAPIVLIPAGVLTYMIYLGYTKGDPLLFKTAEATDWTRHFDWIWNTYAFAIKELFTNPFESNLFDIMFTVLPLGALALGWRRLPLHYSLFALAIVIFSLSFPVSTIEPLASHEMEEICNQVDKKASP